MANLPKYGKYCGAFHFSRGVLGGDANGSVLAKGVILTDVDWVYIGRCPTLII